MTLRYLSVCSGIEAATMAWHGLGWEPVAFSEIEPFPCAVLAHHYPTVPNWGDMTKFEDWPDATFDVLCGGTPCQSFSVAGLRKGLSDPRGNLMLTFGAIAGRYRPRWLVWENVPGVLSSNGGRDFGTFLGMLGQLGYGFAYRVLDAQHVRTCDHPRAVPQRRRRVFVVGHLGDWRRAAAVLFDRESLSGHPPPRREAGQRPAPTISARPTGGGGLGTDFDCDGGLICADIAQTLNAHFGDKQGLEDQHINGGCGLFVSHALRGEGFDASEDGSGRGTPIVPVAFGLSTQQTPKWAENVSPTLALPSETGGGQVTEVAFSAKDYGADAMENVAPTMRAGGHAGSHANAGVMPAIAIQERAVAENPTSGPDGAGIRTDGAGIRTDGAAYTLEARQQVQAVAFDLRGREGGAMPEGPHDTASLRAASGGSSRSYVAQPWAVRRLTPKEAERLMGFPDDFTKIPWRGKPAEQCPDGPRYKALGNSWAVPAARWIGDRIAKVDQWGGHALDQTKGQTA